MPEPAPITSPVITEAGFTAALAAEQGGFRINITHIAVGDAGYDVPLQATGRTALTALTNERRRVEIQDAREVGDGQTDLSFIVDGAEDYAVREIGVFLDDGTLFAIASDPVQALLYKTSLSVAAVAVELVLSTVPIEAINIVSAGPSLNLLMTREIATISAFQMRLQLEQLRQRDAISNLQG